MSDNPYVLIMPLAFGGKGREGVYNFYRDYFLGTAPRRHGGRSDFPGRPREYSRSIYP
jgi:hypothetical protein